MALDNRYRVAKADAGIQTRDSLDKFETAVANAQAVLTRSDAELHRLTISDREVYTTYYKLIEAGFRLPQGSKWDTLRAATDSVLFPNYKDHIRFASLSLDGKGLSNYGECSILLRESMITHRASVFEENSILFMKRHGVKVWEADKLPEGYRATWKDRAKLCVAKLAAKITPMTKAEEYPDLLLRQGATSEEDEFVEVHIWGPMTVRTIDQVIFTPKPLLPGRAARFKALKERLDKYGVKVK